MINTDSRGFTIDNLNELNKEHSPSIPIGFPKSRLPGELCQHALTEMILCVTQKQHNLCGSENKLYYICKRERDAQIFESIKEWEVEEVQKLQGTSQRKKYYDDLELKRTELVKAFEKTPASIGNKNKRWRMAADIEQLKWRLDNIKPQVFTTE